jgi:hypothetical protein
LDQVEHFILALEQQVVKAQKDSRAIGEGARAPRRLGGSCAGDGKFQIRDGSGWDGADVGTGVWRAHANCLMGPVRQSDLREQAITQ